MSCEIEKNIGTQRQKSMMEQRPKGLSIRAVLISFAAIAIIAYVTPRWLTGELPLLDAHFSRPNTVALGVIIILILVNWFLKKLSIKYSFSDIELITIYGMTLTGGIIAQNGYFSYHVFGIIVEARDVYLLMNQKSAQWLNALSPWVSVKGEDAAVGFWMGSSPVFWAEWIRPILMWAIFVTLLYFTFLCLFTLVRKHWNEEERLQYPLAQSVLSVASPHKVAFGDKKTDNIWKDYMLWIGVGISFVIASINQMSVYFDAVTPVPMEIGPLFQELFSSEPWRSSFAVSPEMRFRWDPLLIGVGYILPAEISFSMWFLYVFHRVVVLTIQSSIGAIDRWESILNDVFGAGAFLGLSIMSLWYARANIKEMLRSAIRGERTEDEVLSPRTAIFGGIAGFISLVVFSNVFLFASPLGASFWLIFFLTGVLALARLRAQAGLPIQSGVQDPSIPLFNLFG